MKKLRFVSICILIGIICAMLNVGIKNVLQAKSNQNYCKKRLAVEMVYDKQIKKSMLEMQDKGIHISHSMSDVARLTERLLVMNNSKLAMDGTPEQVFARAEELLAMGLDIPPVTRVFLRLRELGLKVDPVFTLEQATAALAGLKGGNADA